MITGASYGTLGSSRAQLQLRQILNAPEIKANVLPDEFLLSHSLQAFDQNGDLVDLDVIQKLDAIFNDFRNSTNIRTYYRFFVVETFIYHSRNTFTL